MIAAIRRAVTSPLFDQAIMAIIVVNAVTLGLETSATVMAAAGGLLKTLDMIFLWIFTVELALKLLVHGRQFPRDPWRIFDLAVVAIAYCVVNFKTRLTKLQMMIVHTAYAST